MRAAKSLIITGLILVGLVYAEAQIRLPQPSPQGSVSSVVGLTNISIEYFRPKMKGRKIFGTGSEYLVPFGNIWRTGANSGSVITFDTDVKVGGMDVPKGEYLILTVPGESWSFILYKNVRLGGNVANFKESDVLIKVDAASSSLTESVELMTFNIADISEDNTSATIELAWENTSVKVPVTVDFDSQVMAAIEANTTVNPQNYAAAANYYFNTGRDLKQAIAWMEMFIEGRENQFWNTYTMARMLLADGQYEAAMKTSELSMEKATAAPDDFGYISRNEALMEEIKSKMTPGKKKKKSKS